MSKIEPLRPDRSNVASVLCSTAGNLGLLEYTLDNLTMDRTHTTSRRIFVP